MDLFGKDLEHRPLDPPGVCFICETSPTQDTTRIINTNRHFHPGGPTHLTGRKYVCEPCAIELGKVAGMADRGTVEGLSLELAATKELLATAEARELVRNDLIAAVQAGIDNGLLPAPKPKKKPENRPYETDRVKTPIKAAKES